VLYENSVARAALHGAAFLVADDDADNLEILHYLIGQEGGKVRSAASAREALELLLTWTPDVLVLDISMPDMDGYELLSAIRGVTRLREVPAVAVTAHAYERDRDRCIQAGFVQHLPKPYDPVTLIEVLAGLSSRPVPEAAGRFSTE
jgi:CheY-like chemotaxis protein